MDLLADGSAATPEMRLEAIRLIGMVRTLTSPEMRAMVHGMSLAQAADALETWLRDRS